jgi:DNA-binding transcriptional ArsR family regulator
MSATATPRVELVDPIHSAWNRRFRRSGLAVWKEGEDAAAGAVAPGPKAGAGGGAVVGVRVSAIVSPENVCVAAIIHAYVNDGMSVKMWQDGFVDERVTELETAGEPPAVREVDTVETLKALADPTRMAILSAMTRSPDLPVMSVKELAANLGEPQTKLYRHVRQLEEAGLIRVAATRMVSGILEQRYQACQRDLRLSSTMLRENMDEAEVALQIMLDEFRDGVLAATLRESEERPVLFLVGSRLTPAAAAELRRRLKEVNDWLDQQPEDPDGVLVNLMVGLYTGEPSRSTGSPA